MKPATSPCGGKYTSCNCASGYEWKNGVCSKALPKCQIGYIFYTDNTCSYNLDNSKTPKGVVVYAKSGGGGYAVFPNEHPSSAPSTYLMENQYYNDMPKLTLTEAQTNFSTSGGLGISAGAAQSMVNNATEVGYALMKAGMSFRVSSSIWGGNTFFITNTAVSPFSIGGDKAVWGFIFTVDRYGANGEIGGFQAKGLIEIPLSAFGRNIYIWQGFEF